MRSTYSPPDSSVGDSDYCCERIGDVKLLYDVRARNHPIEQGFQLVVRAEKDGGCSPSSLRVRTDRPRTRCGPGGFVQLLGVCRCRLHVVTKVLIPPNGEAARAQQALTASLLGRRRMAAGSSGQSQRLGSLLIANSFLESFASLPRRFSPLAPVSKKPEGDMLSGFLLRAVRMATGAALQFSSGSGVCSSQTPSWNRSLRFREGSHPSTSKRETEGHRVLRSSTY